MGRILVNEDTGTVSGYLKDGDRIIRAESIVHLHKKAGSPIRAAALCGASGTADGSTKKSAKL